MSSVPWTVSRASPTQRSYSLEDAMPVLRAWAGRTLLHQDEIASGTRLLESLALANTREVLLRCNRRRFRVGAGDGSRRDLVGVAAGAARLGTRISPAGADSTIEPVQPKRDSDRHCRGHNLQSSPGGSAGQCPAAQARKPALQGLCDKRFATHNLEQELPCRSSGPDSGGAHPRGRRRPALDIVAVTARNCGIGKAGPPG